MMSKPKYIVILTGLFCSIVAGGTSHFYLFFFRYYFGKVDFFGMTTLAFSLASQVQAKNVYFFLLVGLHMAKLCPFFDSAVDEPCQNVILRTGWAA